MGKISIDLNSLKAAGVYTLEVDNSQRSTTSTNALRMLVGFSNKGPFNRPVLLENDNDRTSIYGDIDTKLEHKGCYFNRMLRTLLTNGPVIALNLLKVDDKYNGPDQVNYAALSLDAGTTNPRITTNGDGNVKYGEYDYLAETLDNTLYNTAKGDNVPYIGSTPYSSLYNRARFWTPDKDLLTGAAARGLNTNDEATFEYTNLLNFANVGTEEFSILVFKPGNIAGYDVTAETWYGGKENIPFGWVRPYDYISDYFLQVVCVKGNWSNYPVLSTDPIWGSFFDNKGIIKNKINSFMSAEGITILGSWTGSIIPDFTDKQGTQLSLEKRINASTERTGLLMSFNNDAANVLTFDYTGKDSTSVDPDQGVWGIDIDSNAELEDSESTAKYIVDMVGHSAFMQKEFAIPEYEAATTMTATITEESVIKGTRDKKYIAPFDITLLKADGDATVKVGEVTPYDAAVGTYIPTNLFVNPAAANIEVAGNGAKALIAKEYVTIASSGSTRTLSLSANAIEVERVTVSDVTPMATVVLNVAFGTVEAKVTFTNVKLDDDKVHFAPSVTAPTVTVQVKKEQQNDLVEEYYGINFLSYNYVQTEGDGVLADVQNAHYFNDTTLWADELPVNDDVKNMFIIDSSTAWTDNSIKVGDYVRNITFNNNVGETAQYNLIPGLTRVIKKQFIQVANGNEVTYNGKKYIYNGAVDTAKNGNVGFYLITCTAPVLLTNNTVKRQLPISDDTISHSLRFIPLKGLTLTSRHRPGYDANGNLQIEDGIEKIYSVLMDEGIHRGLMNPEMVDYRYIIDSMSYGLRPELGGKVYLSKVAYDRGKCTALLNLPSAKQFAVSSNPYFCDSYIPSVETRPSLNTKYIPDGGNTEMGSTSVFSLPSEDNGAKFTACLWPNVIYTENGRTVSVPPAADVANVLNRKFTGVSDPYCICANQNGILNNKYLTGLEFLADRQDREYLEPFGVNTIIKDSGNIMIYGNQTAYQSIKSDFNKLHVRENLNTVEIECEAILRKYNFLYNTPAVRANIVAQLTPVLQVMQTSGAIAQYEIICDETNNTSEVIEADTCVVDVNLWFNHGMEKIVQTFTVNRHASLED